MPKLMKLDVERGKRNNVATSNVLSKAFGYHCAFKISIFISMGNSLVAAFMNAEIIPTH